MERAAPRGLQRGEFTLTVITIFTAAALRDAVTFAHSRAGYGIETLFSLLDRLNRTIGQTEEKKAAAPGDEAKRGG